MELHSKQSGIQSQRRGPKAALTDLESRAIRHATYLHRLVNYDGARRAVLPLSAEFLLEVSCVLRELVVAARMAA